MNFCSICDGKYNELVIYYGDGDSKSFTEVKDVYKDQGF